MSSIIALASQYELLEITSSYLSAIDLLNLASTCSALYTEIRKHETIFERLKRATVCDGRGLKARQEFQRFYFIPPDAWTDGIEPCPEYDEEVEVRVWNLKCDVVNALPCIKCNVNICEECRYVPRVREGFNELSRRRPHRDSGGFVREIRCYCETCDVQIESSLPLRLSEFCDCDQYTRWICIKCREEEETLDTLYLQKKTKGESEFPNDESAEGMWIVSHQDSLTFWCPCGARAPSDGNIRCAWCSRRHRGTSDSYMRDVDDNDSIPFFDNDPCCPKEAWQYNRRDGIYPRLGYSEIGPIAP